MIANRGIYRAANMLIERHGVDTIMEAGKMIDAMLERADLEGRAVWQRILRAIVIRRGRFHAD